VLKVTQKEGPNQGRKFWCCPNGSQAARCKFFEWEDGVDAGVGSGGGGGGGGGFDGSGSGGFAGPSAGRSGGGQSGGCFKVRATPSRVQYSLSLNWAQCGEDGHWASGAFSAMSCKRRGGTEWRVSCYSVSVSERRKQRSGWHEAFTHSAARREHGGQQVFQVRPGRALEQRSVGFFCAQIRCCVVLRELSPLTSKASSFPTIHF
jgi:hypothetical protein